MTDGFSGTGGYAPGYSDPGLGGVPRVLGGRYELAQQIGRGGMAEVYAGRDTRLGRTVAVKVLKTDLARDPAFQSRFKREAQSAASLNHPAIVAVYDTGDEEMPEAGGGITHLPFIVMEYLRGRTLKEVLAQHQRLSPDDALRVTAGVLDALQYSHLHGIVHRDIKPANVMVTDAGEVKVMDFGIARAIADTGATMTGTNAVLGTAQYLSPEQAKGETVDNRSDLYSTACLMYELLTGRPPFVGDSPVSLAYQHVGEQPQPPSTLVAALSPDIDRVVMRGLAKDREVRYQNAEEFIADLDRVATGLPIPDAAPTQAMRPPPAQATQRLAPTPAPWPTGTAAAASTDYDDTFLPGRDYDDPPKRSLLWLWIVLGVLALGAVIALAAVLTSGDGEAPPPTESAPVSVAPVTVAVPDVTGDTYEVASAELQALGFTSVTRMDEEQTDPAIVAGTVIRQDPAADPAVAVPLDTQIVLTVAAPPGQVAIPSVVGLSQAEARTTLVNAGFQIGDVTPEDSPSVARGLVTRTDPAADAQAARGSIVTIYTSSGQVSVIDVLGQPVEDALNALEQAGLQGRPEIVASSEPEGTVIEQNPASGRVDLGTTIDLLVSSGTPPTTAPVTTPTTPSPSTTPTTPTTPPPSTTQ